MNAENYTKQKEAAEVAITQILQAFQESTGLAPAYCYIHRDSDTGLVKAAKLEVHL